MGWYFSIKLFNQTFLRNIRRATKALLNHLLALLHPHNLMVSGFFLIISSKHSLAGQRVRMYSGDSMIASFILFPDTAGE